MSYSKLYNYCQGLNTPISRRQLIPKVQELAKRPRPPKIIASGINPAKLAGFFLWPGNTEHQFAKFGKGEPVILVARDLNYCWKRFVIVKELMHYFDQPLHHVNSEDDFSSLLQEFSGPQPDRSPAMDGEVDGLWRALGVLCPELLRQQLQRQRESGEIDDMMIAQKLKIPKLYVPTLFDPSFKNNISELCEC